MWKLQNHVVFQSFLLFCYFQDALSLSVLPRTPFTALQNLAVDRRKVAFMLWTPFLSSSTIRPGDVANAAPPIGVMMEELGYFPVTQKNGEVFYVPARVRRDSTEQATALADYMRRRNIVLAGAYWCPHCRRQRELFGRQANVPYRECDPRGYQSEATTWCRRVHISGYPTWVQGTKVLASGEMPLHELAKKIDYPGVIDESLEENIPRSLGSSACKQ